LILQMDKPPKASASASALTNIGPKGAVRAAYATPFPGAAPQGIELENGDRVLLYGEQDPTLNGIFVVSLRSFPTGETSCTLRRAADAADAAQLQAGILVWVAEGTDADKALVATKGYEEGLSFIPMIASSASLASSAGLTGGSTATALDIAAGSGLAIESSNSGLALAVDEDAAPAFVGAERPPRAALTAQGLLAAAKGLQLPQIESSQGPVGIPLPEQNLLGRGVRVYLNGLRQVRGDDFAPLGGGLVWTGITLGPADELVVELDTKEGMQTHVFCVGTDGRLVAL